MVNRTVVLVPAPHRSEDFSTISIPLDGLLPLSIEHGGRTYRLSPPNQLPVPCYEEVEHQNVPASDPNGGAPHRQPHEACSDGLEGAAESRAVPGGRGDVLVFDHTARHERERLREQAQVEVAITIYEALKRRLAVSTASDDTLLREELATAMRDALWRASGGRP